MKKSTLFLAVLALALIYVATGMAADMQKVDEDPMVTCIVSGKEMKKSEAKGSKGKNKEIYSVRRP